MTTPTPTIVLLRGLAREAAHWGPFVDVLRQACPGWTVVTPDLPGFGTRSGEKSPLALKDLTDSVRSTIDASASPRVLVGLSMGGMIALDWRARFPAEVAAVVVINSSARPSPFWKRLQPKAWTSLLKIGWARTLEAREREVFRLTSAGRGSFDVCGDEWVAIARARLPPRSAVVRQLISAARFHPRLSAEGPPVQVIVSAGDAMVSPECSRALADRLGAPIDVHPWAGHDLPLDDPAWLAARIATVAKQFGAVASPQRAGN